ncbi:Lectin-domain containing receptor kinase A4.3 [Hordeum vulgare]|nr:Lectin-domain containing receptor kinase A4.3 [Hordeum vulgare]
MDDDVSTLDIAADLACLASVGSRARNEAAAVSSLAAALEKKANIVKNSQLVCEAGPSDDKVKPWATWARRCRCDHGQHRLVAPSSPTSRLTAHVLHAGGARLSMAPTIDLSYVLLYGLRFIGGERGRAWHSSPECTKTDLNVVPVSGGSSSQSARKRPRELAVDAMKNAHNLFDRMPAAEDEDNRVFMEGLLFEGGLEYDIPYDPDEIQSQDGLGYSLCEGMPDPLMEDQLGLDNSFPIDHELPEDYGLDEEDDEVDIDGEPLFNELPAQANAKNNKRKGKRTKAYTQNEDNFLCACWSDIGQDPKIDSEQKAFTFSQRLHREFHERKKFKPYQMNNKRVWVSLGKSWSMIQQECKKFCFTLESIEARPLSGISLINMVFQALEAFKIHYEGKSFNLTHCRMIINGLKSSKHNTMSSRRVEGRKPLKSMIDTRAQRDVLRYVAAADLVTVAVADAEVAGGGG